MKLKLREVKISDIKKIYQWRDKSREMMFQTQPISWKEHEDFWTQRLKNNNACSFIIICEGNEVGLLRLDKKEEFEEVGIIIDKQFQGKGIGAIALKKLAEVVKTHEVKRLVARIKPENIYSKKAFEKAGFKEKYVFYELDI